MLAIIVIPADEGSAFELFLLPLLEPFTDLGRKWEKKKDKKEFLYPIY